MQIYIYIYAYYVYIMYILHFGLKSGVIDPWDLTTYLPLATSSDVRSSFRRLPPLCERRVGGFWLHVVEAEVIVGKASRKSLIRRQVMWEMKNTLIKPWLMGICIYII